MYKFLLLFNLSLLTLVFIFTGCGNDSVSIVPTALPTGIVTPTVPPPLDDSQLQILTNSEIASNKNLKSLILYSIFEENTNSSATQANGPVTQVLIKSSCLFMKIYKGVKSSDEPSLKDINNEVREISNQITEINNEIKALQSQLLIGQVDIIAYMASMDTKEYESKLESVYSTNSPLGFYYFSDQALKISQDPNNIHLDIHVPMANLQSKKDDYKKYVTVGGMPVQPMVDGIYRDLICPLSGPSVLKSIADYIIVHSNASDANSAMNAYLLLENYFIRLITHQLQGAIILTNVWNDDPNDPGQATSRTYVNTTLKKQLTEEVAQFLSVVDYMAINLVDYRTADNYKNESFYLGTSSGLSSDYIYKNMLARSRFLCAQIMSIYGDNSYGLYGSIVTPYDYSPGINKPAQSISLEFTSGGTVITRGTAQVQKIIGQYPYTLWKGTTVSPDNTWSFFEFSPSSDVAAKSSSSAILDYNLPAGIYGVYLNDGGNTDAPWYHSSTLLGVAKILYYDPRNPTTGTTVPTETNTVKFGYFSARWNWGYQALNNSFIDKWNIFTSSDFPNATFYPTSSTSERINKISFYYPTCPGHKYDKQILRLILYFKFKTELHKAQIFFHICYDLHFHTSDGGAKLISIGSNAGTYNTTIYQIEKEYNDVNISNVSMYGVGGTFSPEDVTPDSYNYLCIGLGADTKISSNCHSDASGSTIWSLQPVFTNKYNIFQ